jgi:membrane-associated phospholipid phosphatase
LQFLSIIALNCILPLKFITQTTFTTLNERRRKILLYTVLSITAGFILLSVFIYLVPSNVLDVKFTKEVQEHQNPLLDTVMEAISWPGYVPVSPIMVIAVAGLFFAFKYRKEALFVLLTMLSGLISTVFKFLVNRPRPTEDLVRVVMKNAQQSFPSGHVLFYVIFFGFLVLLMFRLKSLNNTIRVGVSIICLFLIFTIPFSRIYLGAHWFTDVLGGFLLGIVCLYIIGYVYLQQSASKKGD